MPAIEVSDNNTALSYEDTGAPADHEVYSTVVLIHGSIFHGGIFNRLIPCAAKRKIRLVLLNTRDYPGSTPYSEEDLRIMNNGDRVAQEEFIRDQGREIAFFIEKFIRSNHIPPFCDSDLRQRAGGVVLAAWSLGNALSVSMLAHAASLPLSTRTLLDQYLRTVLFFDASAPSLGILPAEGVYHPMRDTSLSFKERGEIFFTWVSSYFPPVTSLTEVSPAFLASRNPLTDNAMLPTVKGMTPPELASATHFGALASNLALRQVDHTIYADNLRRSLVDTGGVWKRVKALVVWCDMSVADCVWAAKGILNLVKDENANKRIQRDVEFVKLGRANHFVHWDDPERLMQVFDERS